MKIFDNFLTMHVGLSFAGTLYLDRGTPKLSSWLCRKQFAKIFNHKVNNFSIALELPVRLIIYFE